MSNAIRQKLNYAARKTTRARKTSLFKLEFDREEDGRWIAEIPQFPGAMAYGATKDEATRRAYGIALRTLADTVERGQRLSPLFSRLFA